jgi:hypothetical protein
MSLLQGYLQHRIKITAFHEGIEYTSTKGFKKIADEVSDARRATDHAEDVDKGYELITEPCNYLAIALIVKPLLMKKVSFRQCTQMKK